jgi:CcmD family protein
VQRVQQVLRAGVLMAALAVLWRPGISEASQPQPPKDFVPVDESAPGEQIPAMPLIGAAYGFIWVAVFGYVWSLGRKLQKVDAEISELERRKK